MTTSFSFLQSRCCSAQEDGSRIDEIRMYRREISALNYRAFVHYLHLFMCYY